MSDLDESRTARWLKARKIYFETVSTCLLSLMAVILSAGQFFTARQQARLGALQLELARAEALPRFDIELHSERNTDNRFTHEILSIDNVGKPLSGFKCDDRVVLFLDCHGKRNAQLTIAVVGYFFGHGLSGAARGRLLTASAPGNWERLGDLETAIRAKAGGPMESCQLDHRVYLNLQYQTSLGETRTQYFEVSSPHGQVEISPDRWNEIIRISTPQNPQDFWKLSADELLSKAGLPQ